jgi:hypothetical protein
LKCQMQFFSWLERRRFGPIEMADLRKKCKLFAAFRSALSNDDRKRFFLFNYANILSWIANCDSQGDQIGKIFAFWVIVYFG